MFHWFTRREAATLPFSTDVHCHLVPGIDDGSDTAAKSVDMLRRVARWGITRVIPTPHVTEDTFENTPATIDPAYGTLVAAVREAGIGVELLGPSAEYRIDSFFLDSLERGQVRPLSGNYLLVENSYAQEPWDLDEVLFNLSVRGYRPVLAHPERYMYYHSHPGRYRRLHDSGVLFQCNLLSLAGYYGKEVRRTAQWMVDENLIDFLGTDLHAMRHVDAIEDYLKTSHCRRVCDTLAPRLLNDKI